MYNFNTVLYQFLETGTSDITFMGRDQELKRLAFSLYRFHFSFTVPLISFLKFYLLCETLCVSEFNEFELRLKSAKNRVQLSAPV